MLRLLKLAVQECLVQQLHLEIYLAVFFSRTYCNTSSLFYIDLHKSYTESNRTLVHLLIPFTY